MRDAFAETYPDVTILLNFANSATLAAPALSGRARPTSSPAPMSCRCKSPWNPRAVDEADVEIFAHNRLVLIVPAGNRQLSTPWMI